MRESGHAYARLVHDRRSRLRSDPGDQVPGCANAGRGANRTSAVYRCVTA